MKVYEQLSAALMDHGVDTMFGLLGDANMYVAGAFQGGGGRFVRVAHEAGAVSMADGYARMSGRPGVATVTHGPGFTNSLTAMVEAQRFPSAVLLITGDTPGEATHMQRLDIAAVCASLGIPHEYVHRPETVIRDVNRIMRRVRTGPVVLNLPLPLSRAEATGSGEVLSLRGSVRPEADESALDGALGLLASASRPVVIAGRGVVTAGAEQEVQQLADLLGAPLFTTALARGLFRGHPRHLGIMGSLSPELAVQSIADADCVIAFGASLNKYTTMSGELLSGKHLVQVDTNPVKLGWLVEPEQAILGDARAVAGQMVALLRDAELKPAHTWARLAERVTGSVAAWVPADDHSTTLTVDVRLASRELNQILPVDCVVVSDTGRFVAGVWPYLDRTRPGDFTAMTGFGSIGLGLAAGIGAATARPDELVVVLAGDGGFIMSAAELSTAVRERLRMLVLVFDDGAYGAEYMKLIAEGFDPKLAYNQWPDLANVARGLGAQAYTVRTIEDVRALTPVLADMQGPVVVDVRLDPTHHITF